MSDSSPTPVGRNRADAWLGGALLAVTALLFLPVLRWLAADTLAHEQLKNAFVVMVAATAALLYNDRRDWHWHGRLGGAALAFLGASYLLAGLSIVAGWSLAALPAFLCAAGAVCAYAAGPAWKRLARPLLVGLGGFSLLLLLREQLDWPLRVLAGTESARLLHGLGLANNLVVQGGEVPRLLLHSEHGSFLVAPECNGFGLLGSAVLLALILGQDRRSPRLARLIAVPAAAAVAFLLNVARILAIVLLAPSFPGNYNTLHEVAGLVALWTGLAAVYYLSLFRLDPPARAR